MTGEAQSTTNTIFKPAILLTHLCILKCHLFPSKHTNTKFT